MLPTSITSKLFLVISNLLCLLNWNIYHTKLWEPSGESNYTNQELMQEQAKYVFVQKDTNYDFRIVSNIFQITYININNYILQII